MFGKAKCLFYIARHILQVSTDVSGRVRGIKREREWKERERERERERDRERETERQRECVCVCVSSV